MMRALVLIALAGLAVSAPGTVGAAEPPATDLAIGRTPPRLSFVDGEVSFRRAGVADWAPAAVNTPLVPGDELYTGARGNFELQVGARAFVRAGAGTYLAFANHEPDFLQFKVTAGHASFDLRSLEPGRTVELDSPNAVFTIEHPGYYRADVSPDVTSFISRRGGRATVTAGGGTAAALTPSEQVIVTGTETPRVETYVASQLDAWDQWNYDRTDHLIEALSARYVSPDVYGVDALDHYGTWRVVPAYGPLWVPAAVATGWVPYSTGTWVWDPYYRWTWVDTAPWGWAPYHYGRWVFVDGLWAWAPGPIVAVPAYAPALVAFFGGESRIGWVALGWGEPCVPWWGPVGFVGVPWWAGWGGPRIVNNVVVSHTTVVHATNITVYRNTTVRDAVVVVHPDRFGERSMKGARVAGGGPAPLAPFHGALPVTPRPMSLAPAGAHAIRPSEAELRRPSVATRAPRELGAAPTERPAPLGASAPPTRLVPAPPRPQAALEGPRPSFGPSRAERAQPPLPPRFQERRPEAGPPAVRAIPERGVGPRPAPAPALGRPAPPITRAPAPGVRAAPIRPLPGEPANRLFPGRSDRSPTAAPQSAPGTR